ncbi:MAG: TlpA family protein disulfide reductase [Bryobacterales bacterium]|nr:TlpA family protein disulfide reductase [Bryobacterales bacterium]
MKRFLFPALLAALLAPAQTKPKPTEDDELRQAMGEAGSSPMEISRALEKHLARYPKSPRREEIERALTKAAIDNRDNVRILRYGEKYLEKNPNDLVVLERVTRLLTAREDRESNERGLKYAQWFEKGMRDLEKEKPATRMDAQLREDLDRGLGRAFTFQARAKGHLGQHAEAVELARKSFEAYASGEPAREIAVWLIKQNKIEEALPHLADAFSLPDVRLTDEDRMAIRRQMGGLYKKLRNSETGLGDIVLAAYDRSIAIEEKRRARLKAIDPNAGVTSAMDYTITGVNGETLDLKSLRGKVVLLDFWATWCGPCRVQYPIYEKVKASFKGRNDVVFLGINTDQEHDVVKPFLAQNKWNKAVYYEDGLSNLLKVASIPTTMIFNRNGQMTSRLNGFVPERFEEMLRERIEEALKEE